VDAYINRGGALAAMNRTTEASAAFSRAVELDPNSAKAHGYLGRVLQALGREFEAQNHLRRAAELEQASSVHR
jgi:Flp pilus assembly protein TadD